MDNKTKVVVTSKSFSKNSTLRAELLERYSNVKFNDDGLKLEGNQLIEILIGHDKAITALEKLDEYVLSKLPDLQVVSKYGVGTDMIDFDAMKRFQKKFGWTAGVTISANFVMLHWTDRSTPIY